MNRKQLSLLIIACLVIGGVGLLLSKRKQDDWSKSGQELGQKLLPDFALNDAALVRIKNHEAEVTVAKTGDEWRVQQRKDYPAGFNEITDALRKLWDLKVAEPVEIERGQLWRLNLLPPDAATNGGTLVEIKDQAGKALAMLTLGKEYMKQGRSDSPFGGGGSFPEGRYVMVGDDTKKVALIKDTLSTLAPNPASWLSKDFFKVEKLKTITVTSTNATNNWKLTRDTEGGEWKLADAKGDEKADSSKCSSLNWLLQSPSFNDLATDWQFNETNKPITTATLETFDHFAYTVKLAPKAGDDYHLQVAVSADLPKERTGASTNETAEVKEKLDKEFKEKTDKLKEKLKTEQPLQPWTYIVTKWTVDTLLKDRSEFLAEKKEEPKPAEAPKPPATPPAPPPLPPAANPADSLVPKLNEK